MMSGFSTASARAPRLEPRMMAVFGAPVTLPRARFTGITDLATALALASAE